MIHVSRVCLLLLSVAVIASNEVNCDDFGGNKIRFSDFFANRLSHHQQQNLDYEEDQAAFTESPTTLSPITARPIILANQHLKMIRQNYSCELPRPKLVRVKNTLGYDDPSKTYIPGCTLLYRCDDETGCCEDTRTRCAPVEEQAVPLYFHVLTIVPGSREPRRTQELLTLTNHTRCQCQEINHMPRTQEIVQLSSIQEKISAEPRQQLFSLKARQDVLQATTYPAPSSLSYTPTESHIAYSEFCKHFECPEPFAPRYQTTGCICDCFSSDQKCLRIKRGEEKLSYDEAHCVRKKICTEPECEHGGPFNKREGSCPKSRMGRPKTHNRQRHSKHKSSRRD